MGEYAAAFIVVVSRSLACSTLHTRPGFVSPPWDGILSAHGRALRTLSLEIESITRGDRASAGLNEIDIAGEDAIGLVPDRSVVLRLVDDEL